LNFTGSNFTLASYLFSRFANATGTLGVSQDASDICLQTIFQTLQLYGVAQNATAFCGLGTQIPVNYECKGRTSVVQMLQSPRFTEVTKNCKAPLGEEIKCKKCLNAGIGYLHHIGI